MDDGFTGLMILVGVGIIAMAAITVAAAISESRQQIACFNAAGSNAAAIAACKQGN